MTMWTASSSSIERTPGIESMNDENEPLIRLVGVRKVFYTDEIETHALSDVHL